MTNKTNRSPPAMPLQGRRAARRNGRQEKKGGWFIFGSAKAYRDLCAYIG
jgi:hypothetical protein